MPHELKTTSGCQLSLLQALTLVVEEAMRIAVPKQGINLDKVIDRFEALNERFLLRLFRHLIDVEVLMQGISALRSLMLNNLSMVAQLELDLGFFSPITTNRLLDRIFLSRKCESTQILGPLTTLLHRHLYFFNRAKRKLWTLHISLIVTLDKFGCRLVDSTL